MHSRVAAAMRANIERLGARPGHCRPRRIRASGRQFGLLAFGAIAASLFVAHGLESDIFPNRRAIDSAGFTLCGKPNRRNCVVDGDTIHHNGIVTRIEGIDAPETHGFKCRSERALGMRATMRLLDLVDAGPFEIVRSGKIDTDKYGRQLRDLRRNGRSFGDILIAEGLAQRWDGRRHGWCD
jgi:endonuclease YncB( thermonuclease family)